jgi:hypothetical protein|tara:strand:- start:602 stop:793 length:192 start_codon:yes stop_codon:yes gene_type:complete
MPERDFDPTWKLGNDPRDLEGKFFFLHVDYEQDVEQAAIAGDQISDSSSDNASSQNGKDISAR